MKRLRPMRLRPKYYAAIEKEINRVWDELIYRPLADACSLPVKAIENAGFDPLIEAIQRGVVWYEDGVFRGAFSSSISKRIRELGGSFSKSKNGFVIDRFRVPEVVSVAQVRADERYDTLRRKILQTLDEADNFNRLRASQTTESLGPLYRDSLNEMDQQFAQTVAKISIPPRIDATMKAVISESWARNLDLYIQKWTNKNILELRQKVQANTFSGRRAGNLVKMIQQNYGVSRNKAKFLARQETALLMSKYQETRFRGMGIQRYIWSGADDARERHDHKALNGKIFSWTNPPVVDRRTGRRGNPGEDYNCRCVPIPVIDGDDA